MDATRAIAAIYPWVRVPNHVTRAIPVMRIGPYGLHTPVTAKDNDLFYINPPPDAQGQPRKRPVMVGHPMLSAEYQIRCRANS